MNKVIIIGAGIAGLTAGIYARKRGFDVTVYEKCLNPGGVSTSWKRKGYTIEGGIHWLIGSTPKMQPFHSWWKETGALADTNPVYFKDPVYTYDNGSAKLHLWRDIDKLEKEMLEFAPEDKRAIHRFCRDVRISMGFFQAPKGFGTLLRRAFYTLRFGVSLLHQMDRTIAQYLEMFRNPVLRDFLGSMINDDQNAVSIVYTMSAYSLGDSGYPEGGSTRMAEQMAAKLIELGGHINYGTTVTRVHVENSKATGVEIGYRLETADRVVVALDSRTAVDTLFEHPLQDRWIRRMRRKTDSEQCMFFACGLDCDLSNRPECMRLIPSKPLEVGGKSFGYLPVNNYSWKRGYAPEGGTTLTMILSEDSYDFWKKAKAEGDYRQKKQETVDRILSSLYNVLPEIEGHVVMSDLATPMTYERYCSTWKGGYMGVWNARELPPVWPVKCSIKGVFFASNRFKISGGLPIALESGHSVAMKL